MPTVSSKPIHTHSSRKRFDLLQFLCYLGMFALSFWVFFSMCLRPNSDISIHATWAAEGDFMRPRSFLSHGAHPLWHGLVALVLLMPIPLAVAAALVTAVCKALELALVRALFHRMLGAKLHANTITFFSLACVLVSALCLPWYNPTVYFGVGSPNTWHSPTQMIALVFMLLCIPYTAKVYGDFERRTALEGPTLLMPWRRMIGLGILLLASLLAKPTFMQAFLPAACLYFGVQWLRHPKSSRFFWQTIAVVLPAVLFMVVQYLYYFGIIVPWQAGMALEMSWEKLQSGLIAVALIRAFPLYVLIWRSQKEDWKNPFFALVILYDLVGIIEYLILGETGRRASDGNFGWGMMGSALMLWVLALIRFGESLASARNQRKDRSLRRSTQWGMGIGWALLAWHLASGVYYLAYLLGNPSVSL